MPERPTHAFQHPISVRDADIDELGHVNNVVYLRWVQETAAAHWQQFAPAEMQQAYAWVVLRHEINYFRPAFSGYQLIGHTWVGAHEGPKIIRYVQLCRQGEEALLADAKTTWCLLDARQLKPRRISESIANIFEPK